MQQTTAIEPRMTNIAYLVPDALKALHAFAKAGSAEALPETTTYLVHLRASQINGCSVCAQMHAQELKDAGEPDERIWTVAAWREAPYFSPSERAALALTEAVTRLSDREDPVPDSLWEEATRHYDEETLAALIIQIASINVWNRFNVTTRQPAGAAWG